MVLTLNRPDRANAMNETMQNDLVQKITNSQNPIVITASGSKIFSAGADLKEFSELERGVASKKRRALLKRTLEAVLDFPKPLVVAVQGKALGAGCMLALLADELVMAETAELGLPEIRHGMPTPVGYAIVEARAGMAVARRMVQDGESIGVGLADYVVDAGVTKEKALERAKALAALPADAYRINKAYINAPLKASIAAAFAAAERP